MKCVQLVLPKSLKKQILFLTALILSSVISYTQPIQVANSTGSGENLPPGAEQPPPPPLDEDACLIDIQIICIDTIIGGVQYNYDVIIETEEPGLVDVEHSSISSIIALGDSRWREINETTFAFYIVEPFDLNVTGCDEVDYTVMNWPDCGACYILTSIDYLQNAGSYPYGVYISTSSPESIVIENSHPLMGLITPFNSRFLKVDQNLYLLRFKYPFDMQITDCNGVNFTAGPWPSTDFLSRQSQDLVNANPFSKEKETDRAIDLNVMTKPSINPTVIIDVLDDQYPISMYLSGLNNYHIRKKVLDNKILHKGSNQISLGELPFGVYQIIVQQGNKTKLLKYAHLYE